MNAEDADRRLHWMRLAVELGQEDDFRALLDAERLDALTPGPGWIQGATYALPTQEMIAEVIQQAIFGTVNRDLPQEWAGAMKAADAVIRLQEAP